MTTGFTAPVAEIARTRSTRAAGAVTNAPGSRPRQSQVAPSASSATAATAKRPIVFWFCIQGLRDLLRAAAEATASVTDPGSGVPVHRVEGFAPIGRRGTP